MPGIQDLKGKTAVVTGGGHGIGGGLCRQFVREGMRVAVGYSGALRTDLAPDGVGVTTLCPGPVKTNIDECDRLRPAHAGTSLTTSKGLWAS